MYIYGKKIPVRDILEAMTEDKFLNMVWDAGVDLTKRRKLKIQEKAKNGKSRKTS